MQASWVRLVTEAMSAAVLPSSLSLMLRRSAASTAVWEWNSAGEVGWVSEMLLAGVVQLQLIVIKRTGVGDFEEHILHHVALVRSLKFKLLAAKVDVVEPPRRGAEDCRDALFTLEYLQYQVNSLFARISSSPALAAHRVRRVAIRSHTLAIHPSLRDRILRLLLAKSHHLADDSCRSHFHEHDMVQADFIVRILQRQTSLNLMRLDHPLQHIPDRQDPPISQLPPSSVSPTNPICDAEDST